MFETFELLINILGFIFEEKSMFKNIFQNISEHYVGLDTPILFLNHVIIYKLLSRKLVQFLKLLGMNVVSKMSSHQVVEFCQKNLTIDFPKIMIQAQVFVQPVFVPKKSRLYPIKIDTPRYQDNPSIKPFVRPVIPNRFIPAAKVSVCTVDLAY